MIRWANSHRRVRSPLTPVIFIAAGLIMVAAVCVGGWEMLIGF